MSDNPANLILPTVMSPNASLTFGSGGGIYNAPPFITSITPKSKYRDALRRWMKMIATFAEADNKAKDMLCGAGHIIYMACDSVAQDMLRKAELLGNVCLEGHENDPKRVKLVEEVLSVIAKESPSEKVRHEVELLTEIHKCERMSTEDTSEYANRFNGAVARYANHMGGMNHTDNRQFAVMMVRNAMLSSDTLNALTFQLTHSASEKSQKVCIDVQLDIEATRELLKLLKDMSITVDDKCAVSVHNIELVRDHLCGAIEKATAPSSVNSGSQSVMISMEETSAAIRQVHIETSAVSHFAKSALLGKRSTNNMHGDRGSHLKKMKSENACRVCNELGHWWKDRPECREKFLAQRRQRNAKSRTDGQPSSARDIEPKETDSIADVEKHQSASFFRQGGQ